MLKLIGSLLFVCGTSFVGLDWSKKLSKRPQQIRQLIQSLQLIEAEMGYSQLPLQQIFIILSRKLEAPISIFYGRIGNELLKIRADFLTIWDQELDHLQGESNLKSNEVEILKQFGRQLGHHTFSEQEKHITLTIYYLQHELEEANELKQKYGKMAKSLGVLIGIFIVLLLL